MVTPDFTHAPSIRGLEYRWVAMGVVLFGVFMVVLDTTLVNLALASLEDDFGSGDGIEWVITAYLAAVGVAQMASGWYGDRFGRRMGFVGSLAGFTITSVLCALAVNLPMLVVARILQGFSGGLMMPVAMAMIYELFAPHERGRAMGYFGIAVMVAPTIGPVLGGGLVEIAGWRSIFLINLPIGIGGVVAALVLLREPGAAQRRRLDLTGLGLSAVGLASVLVGVSNGPRWGWANLTTVSFILVGAFLLAAFGRQALRSDSPLLDVRLLTNPIFTIGVAAVVLLTVSQYARLVFIPLELARVRDVQPFQIGLVMLPGSLGMAMTMSYGGRLADRVGSRLPVTIGALTLGVSFVGLASFTMTTPLWVVSFWLFVGGFGSGVAMMPPNIVALNGVHIAKVTQASAFSQVFRQVGAAFGTAGLAAVFAAMASTSTADVAAEATVDPYRAVYLSAVVVLVGLLILAQKLPGKQRALELQVERQQEITDIQAQAQAAVRADATPELTPESSAV